MPDRFNKDSPADIKDLQLRIAVYEDESAYKHLFYYLFPSLQNFAFSIVKSRQVAEEIASDVLIEVWVRRQKLMEINNLKVYLFTSVKNGAIKKLKQEKKFAQFSLDDLHIEFIADYCNPEEALHSSGLEQELVKAVEELPPRCKIIYKLAKEDKLKYAEIAGLLGISIKTIDSQLSIAVKKIAAAIMLVSKKKN